MIRSFNSVIELVYTNDDNVYLNELIIFTFKTF